MKPILFNTEMVRAILDGRKSMTRRIVKPQPPEGYICAGIITDTTFHNDKDIGKIAFTDLDYRDSHLYKLPHTVGDILWVRETWDYVDPDDLNHGRFIYRASTESYYHIFGETITWHQSIHMPREAARIFLRVTNVRVDRLHEITEDEALKEGIEHHTLPHMAWERPQEIYGKEFDDTAINAFQTLWNSTVKRSDIDKYGWDTNPWVWVYEFERVSER